MSPHVLELIATRHYRVFCCLMDLYIGSTEAGEIAQKLRSNRVDIKPASVAQWTNTLSRSAVGLLASSAAWVRLPLLPVC